MNFTDPTGMESMAQCLAAQAKAVADGAPGVACGSSFSGFSGFGGRGGSRGGFHDYMSGGGGGIATRATPLPGPFEGDPEQGVCLDAECSEFSITGPNIGPRFIFNGTGYVLNTDWRASPYSDEFDLLTGIVVAGPVLIIGADYLGVWTGAELVIGAGRNWRIAPFGNRTPNRLGQLPHYHRRGQAQARESVATDRGRRSTATSHSGADSKESSMQDDVKEIGLIVATEQSALMFSSVTAAESYLEATDVRNGEYPEAYGSDGRPFDVLTDGGDQVVIIEGSGSPDIEAAKPLVMRFLTEHGIRYAPDRPFEELLSKCAPFADDGLKL